MKKPGYVLIMAGGTGTRMGEQIPKQFLLLDNMPVILHTVYCFLEFDSNMEIIIVLPEEAIGQWEQLYKDYSCTFKHTVVIGGPERFYSVKHGLKIVPHNALVAVHDAVRPLVSHATIKACFDTAGAKGNAIPVISTPESLRETVSGSDKSRPLDRDIVKLVQTPQVFTSEILHKAYDCDFSPHFTDDATVVERLGITINLVEGNRENIKITTPCDLKVARALIKDFNKK